MRKDKTVAKADERGDLKIGTSRRTPLRALRENLLLLFDGLRFLPILWKESQ